MPEPLMLRRYIHYNCYFICNPTHLKTYIEPEILTSLDVMSFKKLYGYFPPLIIHKYLTTFRDLQADSVFKCKDYPEYKQLVAQSRHRLRKS